MKHILRSFLWGTLFSGLTLSLGAQDGKSTGTAFVVNAEGYLLTCAHCVKDAGKVEVALGGQSYEAAVLGTDEPHDLAVLQISAKGLSALPLGNSNAVEVGEEVRAFGFPLASVLGANVKVTRGTVSGIETKEAQKSFQIDAPVNPGNSGGPLVNEKGEVIGVVNAKLAGEVVSNVGFAVPINYAKPLLRDEGVEFATEGATGKLDGPALVKYVSPAVALVTAIPKGGPPAPSTPSPPTPKPQPPVSPAQTEEMKKAQRAALDELKGKGVTPPEGMVLVPAGEFEMGAKDGDEDEKPVRQVALNAFWIDQHEVTNAQFGQFVQATGYKPEGGWQAEGGRGNYPAVKVTWNDAVAYAQWAGKRLPTEAEWEKAARGTDGRLWPWGNEMEADKANVEGQADGFSEAAPVGTFTTGASVWGALDLAGNVWEWCADAYVPYSPSPPLPKGGKGGVTGLCRVIRGGSFVSTTKAVRGAERAALLPTVALNQVGFRCVKDEPNLAEVEEGKAPAAPEGPAGASPFRYEGVVQFRGEANEVKCQPLFERVTFRTLLGALTVEKEYVLAVSATEIQLLGGSRLKGELAEKTVKVKWGLGERDIDMTKATYRRTAAPPAVSVDVTKDGGLVPPAFNSQVLLKDKSLVVGDLEEQELRLRLAGVGEVSVPREKVVQLVAEGERLRVVLTDGNTDQGELVGEYHLRLLEGRLTLAGGQQLASLSGPTATIENPTDGSVLVFIPGGEFTMGSPEGQGYKSEHPQSRVRVDSFYLGKYEVTNAQWKKFVDANPEWRKGGAKALADRDYLAHWNGNSPPAGKENHPVVYVSWHAAVAYCEWAGLRLPTEAEWEYAAQGGKGYEYGTSTGGIGPELANYSAEGNRVEGTEEALRYLKPVGSYPANPYGIHDLSGNVDEWCSSAYRPYPYDPNDGREDLSGDPKRVLRGGSWYADPRFLRSAYRGWGTPASWTYAGVGFRVAKTPR